MNINLKWLFKKPHYIRVILLSVTMAIPLVSYTNCSDQRFASTLPSSKSLGTIPSGSFKINNGAIYTNSVGVTAQLEAINAFEVALANGECPKDGAVYAPLKSEMSWVLNDYDGGSPVMARFRDQKGVISDCIEASIILDRKAPLVEFLSGAAKLSIKNNAAFDIKASDEVSGVDKLYCRMPGSTTFIECKNQFDVQNLKEGGQSVTAYAEDKAGNKSDPQEYSFFVDTLAPTVMIKDPLPPVLSIINSVIVNFEGSDGAGSGIAGYACQVNGQNISNCASPVNLNNLADGKYVFAVKAVDKAGLMSAVASVAFEVDTAGSGEFQILGITGGTDVKVDSFLSVMAPPKLHWSVSKDAQSYSVAIYDASNSVLICSATAIPGANINYQFNDACRLNDHASYVAHASSYKNGIEKKAPNFIFKVDASAPVIVVNPVVKDDEKKTATLSFSISDAGTGIKSAMCYKKYNADIRVDDCKSKTSIAYTDLPEGEHEFYIVASDELDHVSTSASVKFSIRYVVCDPFNAIEGKCVKGLKGNLYYASGTDRAAGDVALGQKFYNVGRMIQLGLKSNAVIYLPFLDVRTRNFTDGFGTTDDGKIKDDAGKVLDEWFALDLESVVKLNDTDAEGYYQFVTVSDDGSNLFIGDKGSLRLLVNNDALHSTRVACSALGDVVQMTKASRFPIKVNYLQGPRTEIAMSIFWRKVASKDAALSKHCGRVEQTSAGADAIIAEGFKPLSVGNFILAEEIK